VNDQGALDRVKKNKNVSTTTARKENVSNSHLVVVFQMAITLQRRRNAKNIVLDQKRSSNILIYPNASSFVQKMSGRLGTRELSLHQRSRYFSSSVVKRSAITILYN
jgi:hypothetical protein